MDSKGLPSMSLIDSGGASNIGNYKGVMLCNRPFGGSTADAKDPSTGKKSFSAGVVPESIGLPVSLSSFEKFKTRRSKKDSVLSKHKKWLADLQKTKERLETEYIDDLVRKEEQQKKFQENERKMRLDAVAHMRSELKGGPGSPQTESNNSYSNSSIDSADSKDNAPLTMEERVALLLEKARYEVARCADFKSQPKDAGIKDVAGPKGNNGSNKPAWAMTAKAAKEGEDELPEDTEGLLSFAENLDYDKTILNIETKMVMEKLQSRINEIEKEMDSDEKQEKAIELRSAKREMLALMASAVNGMSSIDSDNVKSEDVVALQTAKAVLESAEALQAIHSTKSVASMIKKEKEKAVGGFGGAGPKVYNEPRIVTHEPNEGARMESKGPSNLPYLHRNPAV